MKNSRLTGLLGLILGLALQACSLAPDYARPEAPVPGHAGLADGPASVPLPPAYSSSATLSRMMSPGG
ncbi:MAG: multidrug transporter, partial [Deltaproteobacteria bacterium]|nr:multidrug transporter [Deltaproteobacteria bacterium]